MHIHSTPKWLHRWLSGFTWHKPTDRKVLYLTFDDGPISMTEWILDVLKDYDAKATFFCVGENIMRNPHIFCRTLAEGHAVGNHTHNHLSGWKSSLKHYLANTALCCATMQKYGAVCRLFRPPYGRITARQATALRQQYELIMWDVLTCDYSPRIRPQDCLQNSIAATQKGSIVVFHDNKKADVNIRYALPRYLAHFADLGFTFECL
ncbi:MAG: polysaccharide deacetylase family protein [Cytophagales bacterium]|nr:polysaccharide deacetylase family protein [Bernardetiaceae bacterium]MDW8205319.1 polysaccharide deacetylase family protein [Cytophagales bacterium]